jgi:hypothetical protein
MKSFEEIEREMHSLGWWYQHFQFPNGLQTGDGREPGYDAQAQIGRASCRERVSRSV